MKKQPKTVDHQNGTTGHQNFETGATRIPIAEHFHAVCPELEKAVAMICAEGFATYPDKSSRAELSTGLTKGLPLYNLVKHANRHWNRWRGGDRSEPHLAKVAWAIAQILHRESGCKCIEVLQNDFANSAK